MKVKVGDIVVYSPFGGGNRTVEITSVEKNIKNGKPGFVGNIVTDSVPEFRAMKKNDPKTYEYVKSIPASVWGYNDQIQSVNEVS